MLIYLQMIESPEEQSKFEKIYYTYRDLMFYIAHGILHNDHDAEDAVHNAFVAIAENIQKIEDSVCPKTKSYIVIVLESKAIDIYRRRQRHPEINYTDENIGLQVDYSQSHAITRCFSILPPQYKHVLLLKYRHGYDNREIAQLLKLSETNVAKLVYRAKIKLDKLCKEEGIR